jgi:predicted DNA-binding protein
MEAQMKKDTSLSIRIPATLKQRISDMARAEKRTLAGQAEYLLERQLDELEGVNSIQVRELAGFMAGGKVN